MHQNQSNAVPSTSIPFYTNNVETIVIDKTLAEETPLMKAIQYVIDKDQSDDVSPIFQYSSFALALLFFIHLATMHF